ncbi:hypothetical protein P22_3068 [Propionispora sp. 2/2-37]|uniref:hypothetical protein n=1 Tax=Propionispora sp. 2/2-37 TaxID=1677858 RepID=UPI0006C39720|nr:hypothetical protein [Propionispora sp. 2/2-37]CUH96954.1 hypothetical protein P22_3068 [Propionispora sp. 2/2-37]
MNSQRPTFGNQHRQPFRPAIGRALSTTGLLAELFTGFGVKQVFIDAESGVLV